MYKKKLSLSFQNIADLNHVKATLKIKLILFESFVKS